MIRVKPATMSDVQAYFSEELKAVIGRHQISARDASVQYLASLLLRHIESKHFFTHGADGKPAENLLSELYIQFTHATGEERRLVLQRLGDICLMMSGFFAENVHSKIVDIDYYFGMGGSAYAHLSEMATLEESRAMYGELSCKFKPFSNVLGELSERSGLQSNKDVLRMYERWVATGSKHLRTLLNEQGIAVPTKLDLKIKH